MCSNHETSGLHIHEGKVLKKPLIFVPMIGQYENIGDIILRRSLMNWLREAGMVHLYVGPAPDQYADALGVTADDVVYRSFVAWYAAALKSAALGNAHYAFKAGEIQLSLFGLKEHISVIPLISLIRLRGGKVIRIGSGSRNFSPVPRMMMKPSLWLSQLVMWRDARTAAYMGKGGVVPDLAFAEGDPIEEMLPRETRDIMIVSMRGDRHSQSGGVWIDALREFVSSHALTIWVVTQVVRDSHTSQSLAESLGAQLLDWDGNDHGQQESKLRDLYRRAAIVVSDRLHVLIAAYTHGALPVGLLSYQSDKIDRHFDVIGISNITLFCNTIDKQEILDRLSETLASRDSMLSVLPVTRRRMGEVKSRLYQELTPTVNGKPKTELTS